MTSMRLTSTCCVRSGAVCQADAIVQGAELGQRQRTAAIRRASERPAKSLRNWIRPRWEITPCCMKAAGGLRSSYSYQLFYSVFSSAFGTLNSTDTRHSPVLDGCMGFSLLFIISPSSLVKQRRDCLRGRLASPRSRHNTFHIHSVSTPASSSWASTSGQKRRMYVSSLPRRC